MIIFSFFFFFKWICSFSPHTNFKKEKIISKSTRHWAIASIQLYMINTKFLIKSFFSSMFDFPSFYSFIFEILHSLPADKLLPQQTTTKKCEHFLFKKKPRPPGILRSPPPSPNKKTTITIILFVHVCVLLYITHNTLRKFNLINKMKLQRRDVVLFTCRNSPVHNNNNKVELVLCSLHPCWMKIVYESKRLLYCTERNCSGRV